MSTPNVNITATNDKLFKNIRDGYFAVRDGFPEAAGKASEDELKKLVTARDAARDAFFAAGNKILGDNNDIVVDLDAELKKATKSINDMLGTLKDAVSFIKLATEIAKLAASIVTLAATA